MKILYVERKANEFVSLEKVFRDIASTMSAGFDHAFQQLPYGFGILDTIRNLLFFRKEPADIYHITGHVNYIALLFSPDNTVLTFHDLRFVYEKDLVRRMLLKKLYLDLPVKRLKYITAVSEHTKREIVDNTGCSPSKVKVLGLPVMDFSQTDNSKEFNKACPLLLQIGTMPNKNVERLIDSISGLECTLRIIGRLSDTQRAHLMQSGVRYENALGLSEEEIRVEYQYADIVTFCSTYEGFGLPIIEAQAAGKPVITSALSPMTETSGGAACLVDPFDVDEIRSGIDRIIADDVYRRELIEEGRRNVKRFHRSKVVPEYERLYAEIAENKAGGRR